MRSDSWTKEQEQLLRDFFPTSSKKKMEEIIPGRTYEAMRSYANKFGIKKAVGFGAKKKWNNTELAFLKDNYANTENSLLCAKFNCSEKSLYSAANKLNVKKSAEHISKTCGDVLKVVGVDTRFKKGDVPKNKGKKWDEFMTVEGQKNARKTTFKKGIVPHNTVAVGHERITRDGYVEVKVGDFKDSTNNFKLKHRLIWESVNGPVPANHQVRFIDGNIRNFDIDNLKLVSLSESLKINAMSDSSVVKRFLGIKDQHLVDEIIQNHNGIIDLKRNALKLNQQINKNERKTKVI
jgi:hypothetical protein